LKAAFTLVELLVVIAVLGVLVAIGLPVTTHLSQYAQRTQVVSNMRQLGVAAHLYANENNQQLPGQPDPDSSADRWPTLLCNYLSPSDPRVFLDPTDPSAAKLPLATVVSNAANNTGYIYNGFDDLAANGVPLVSVPMARIATPSQVVLLAQKLPSAKSFFVDPLLQPLGNLLAVLNPQAFDGGAYYLYADGSVRFVTEAGYSNSAWLVDKTITLPGLPPLPAALDPCLAIVR
jgi:prepilin-type N-terminal cleavage/methylation domain-containing protein/prepilin-type processing-associated H-X9-DG protein